MSRLSLELKVPAGYEKAAFSEIVRAICQQINVVSEGKITARYNAVTVAPSGSAVAYAPGDFVADINATVGASIGSGVPLAYIRQGWINVAAGSPGTIQELRIPTGGVSTVPAGTVWAGPTGGAGSPSFRTLTSSDVPASVQFSITPHCHTLGATVALSVTASYFPVLSTATLPAGVYYANAHMVLTSGAATHWQARIWDGSTIYASGRKKGNNANDAEMVSLGSVIVLGSAAVLTLAARDTANTSGKVHPTLSGDAHDTIFTVLKIG